VGRLLTFRPDLEGNGLIVRVSDGTGMGTGDGERGRSLGDAATLLPFPLLELDATMRLGGGETEKGVKRVEAVCRLEPEVPTDRVDAVEVSPIECFPLVMDDDRLPTELNDLALKFWVRGVEVFNFFVDGSDMEGSWKRCACDAMSSAMRAGRSSESSW
jgi:hypothetical protein